MRAYCVHTVDGQVSPRSSSVLVFVLLVNVMCELQRRGVAIAATFIAYARSRTQVSGNRSKFNSSAVTICDIFQVPDFFVFVIEAM